MKDVIDVPEFSRFRSSIPNDIFIKKDSPVKLLIGKTKYRSEDLHLEDLPDELT